MGLFDFLKKGEEKPVAAKPIAKPTPPPVATQNKVNNTNTAAQNATPGVSHPRKYVIKSGDSLSKIAKEFYGDATQWNKIHQANLDKIKNPDMIHPGQEIVIPA